MFQTNTGHSLEIHFSFVFDSADRLTIFDLITSLAGIGIAHGVSPDVQTRRNLFSEGVRLKVFFAGTKRVDD